MREADPAAVLARLAEDAGRRVDGLLAPEAVEAVDVINHALVHEGHPDGRRIWSEVVRSGTVGEEAQQAVTGMVIALNACVRAKDEAAVVEICDCLATIFEPDPQREPELAPPGPARSQHEGNRP